LRSYGTCRPTRLPSTLSDTLFHSPSFYARKFCPTHVQTAASPPISFPQAEPHIYEKSTPMKMSVGNWTSITKTKVESCAMLSVCFVPRPCNFQLRSPPISHNKSTRPTASQEHTGPAQYRDEGNMTCEWEPVISYRSLQKTVQCASVQYAPVHSQVTERGYLRATLTPRCQSPTLISQFTGNSASVHGLRTGRTPALPWVGASLPSSPRNPPVYDLRGAVARPKPAARADYRRPAPSD
jgi:hypothetical protein